MKHGLIAGAVLGLVTIGCSDTSAPSGGGVKPEQEASGTVMEFAQGRSERLTISDQARDRLAGALERGGLPGGQYQWTQETSQGSLRTIVMRAGDGKLTNFRLELNGRTILESAFSVDGGRRIGRHTLWDVGTVTAQSDQGGAAFAPTGTAAKAPGADNTASCRTAMQEYSIAASFYALALAAVRVAPNALNVATAVVMGAAVLVASAKVQEECSPQPPPAA